MPQRSLSERWHPVTVFRRLLATAGQFEKLTLVVLGGVAAMAFAFIKLAEEVFEGETRGFDTRILLAFRNPADLSDPIGPSWFEESVRDITSLGSVSVLGLVVLAVTGFLVITGRRQTALLVLVSVIAGTLFGSLMKHGFARPRPELVPHGSRIYTASFPSGHATMSAVVYLTLGALLARTEHAQRVKLYILSVAALLTLIVGLSRIYLGVHWPTDVLAGWALGSAWAMISWLAMLWLQSRGQVEPEHDDPEIGS